MRVDRNRPLREIWLDLRTLVAARLGRTRSAGALSELGYAQLPRLTRSPIWQKESVKPSDRERIVSVERSLFEGGGEVGALLEARDWSQSSLGSPERWPQSLRTVVRIMLASRYAMWVGWGSELAFLYNDAYAKMTLGPKHPWALDRPAREVWAEIWEQLSPRIEQVLTTGQATWDEALLLFLERNGYPEESYHTFSYSPLFDDRGAIAGNLCVVTEVTEQVIGERRLSALRTLAEGLAAADSEQDVFAAVERCLSGDARDLPFSMCFLYDEAGTPTLVSSSGFDPAGESSVLAAEAARRAWRLDEIFTDPRPLAVAPAAERFRDLPRGPWQKPPELAWVVPLVQQGLGHPIGVFVAGVNPHRPFDEGFQSFISLFAGQIAAGLSSAHAYEAEAKRVEELSKLDRAKTAFFSNVSHEFRTPLTLMLGPTEDALAGDGVLRRPELDTVHRNELRLLRLVNALLDFARAEAGRTQAHYQATDLAALTEDLASTFRSALERAGLSFEVDCQELGEPVFVDREMWEKIVLNLLSNAFKFTFAGGIRVSLREVGARIELCVSDTGIGIAVEELPRLFERFHRIEGTRSRTHEGSGIGLALVQDLVRLHGGEIRVESRPGHGTTFSVELPKGRAHLPADRVGEDAGGSTQALAARAFVAEVERWLPDRAEFDEAPAALPSARSGVIRRRILVADDNADMRAYLERLLGARHRVELAYDGAQALALALQNRPDLVVTDVMMPELDGFALLASLREQPSTRDVPVLLLSARAGEEARLEGLQAGADDYLVKPFSARELLARVEIQLLKSELRATDDARRRQLSQIFEQAPAAIAILSGPHHVYEIANPAYLALVTGRPILGKPIREALPELADQGVYELLDGVRRDRQPFVGKAFAVRLVRRAGAEPEEAFFDFVFQPMLDSRGEVSGIAIVAFDVTELVRAQRNAEAANRTKDEFLAMLGHELRNPLAPILTALELMRLRGVAGGDHERAIIERQVRHLVGLVDDLLDVSRITRGKVTLKLERVELAEAVARAIEMASPLLERLRHELRVEVPSQGLPLNADPGRLAQVIANLLTNAAKYTETGGLIRVRADTHAGRVQLIVSDTGMGIEAEMLPRIFDFFAQERQALDRSQGGLGLGLAIVKSLVELHGGTVSATSAGRGRGSEFHVDLPLYATAAAQRPRLAEAAAPVQTATGDGARVLVVDDNVDAADMLAEWLASRGFSTQIAYDGLSALERARAFRPAVAVIDIGLPVLDGYELARRMQAEPELGSTRLIALTGYGEERDRVRSREAGFFAHMVKPIDLTSLGETLARALA